MFWAAYRFGWRAYAVLRRLLILDMRWRAARAWVTVRDLVAPRKRAEVRARLWVEICHANWTARRRRVQQNAALGQGRSGRSADFSKAQWEAYPRESRQRLGWERT